MAHLPPPDRPQLRRWRRLVHATAAIIALSVLGDTLAGLVYSRRSLTASAAHGLAISPRQVHGYFFAQGSRAFLDSDEAHTAALWQSDLLAGKFVAPADARNTTLSLCVMASEGEVRWIDEWILTHALLGVEHFYIYDTSHTVALAAALQIWIGLGLVTLVHPTFKDEAILWGWAQQTAMSSCLSRYGDRTDWLASFDVDEYMNFNSNPDLLDVPERVDGRWSYIAHRYLARQRMRAAGGIVMARATFCNFGADVLPLLIPHQTLRETHNSWANVAQKLILHTHHATGHVNFHEAGHSAEFGPQAPPPGISDRFVDVLGDDRTAKDGTLQKYEFWPREHLVLNHFPNRDRADCEYKNEIKLAANEGGNRTMLLQPEPSNWRLADGGDDLCRRRYTPSDYDFGSPRELSPNFHYCTGPLVKDDHLAQSFAARAAQDMLPGLRRRATEAMQRLQIEPVAVVEVSL